MALFLAWSGLAQAETGPADCAAAVLAAERSHATPPGLLERIAVVESGRLMPGQSRPRAWPWTIDVDGRGAFFESRAAAVAGVRQALASGGHLVDVGCMQVNLQMHPGAFRSLDEAFDPATNADYAAGYLRRLFAESGGDWDVAVGLYHSHTPWLGAAYRDRVAGDRVAALGRGLLSGIGGPQPLYIRVMQQGRMRLPTTEGAVLININRQPGGARRRRPTRCEVAAVLAPDMAVPFRVPGCRAR